MGIEVTVDCGMGWRTWDDEGLVVTGHQAPPRVKVEAWPVRSPERVTITICPAGGGEVILRAWEAGTLQLLADAVERGRTILAAADEKRAKRLLGSR
jgi:hypothetical protein